MKVLGAQNVRAGTFIAKGGGKLKNLGKTWWFGAIQILVAAFVSAMTLIGGVGLSDVLGFSINMFSGAIGFAIPLSVVEAIVMLVRGRVNPNYISEAAMRRMAGYWLWVAIFLALSALALGVTLVM